MSGYTYPIADVLYRPEIPRRLLRYLSERQRHQKRYLKHLERTYTKYRLFYDSIKTDTEVLPQAVEGQYKRLVSMHTDVLIQRAEVRSLRDSIHQIHILQRVALKGRRPRKAKFIEGEIVQEG